jgi:hypothetical protein
MIAASFHCAGLLAELREYIAERKKRLFCRP